MPDGAIISTLISPPLARQKGSVIESKVNDFAIVTDQSQPLQEICDSFCKSELVNTIPHHDPWQLIASGEKKLNSNLLEPRVEGIAPINKIYIPADTPYFGDLGQDLDFGKLKSQLEELGGKYDFQVISAESGTWAWLEDPTIITGNDGEKGIIVTNGQIKPEDFEYVKTVFQGVNAQDALSFSRLGDAVDEGGWVLKNNKQNKLDIKEVPVFVEGGNILTTKNKEGEVVSIVGKGSLYANTLILDRQGKLNGDAVEKMIKEKEWSQEEIELSRTTLLGIDGRSPLYSSINSDDLDKKAREFLAKQELTKEVIAKSLNLPLDRVYFVSQAAYHIDMESRPGRNGEIFVRDPSQSVNFLEKLIDDPITPSEDKARLQTMLKNLPQKDNTSYEFNQLQMDQKALDLQAEQLKNSGFTVHRIPDSFEIPILDDRGYLINEYATRYMNGIMGSSKKTGEAFYLVASSGIKTLDKAFAEIMQEHEIKVHFLNNIEALLKAGGGSLDCITLHS